MKPGPSYCNFAGILACRLFKNYSLLSGKKKKKALKVGSQLSECIEHPHATFMALRLYSFKIHGLLLMFICVNDLTKSNSEYQWPLWGTLELSRLKFSSVPQLCPTLCDPMNRSTGQASLSITNSQSLLKLMSIESVMPCRHLILCHPLLLLPSIPPSIRVFSNESTIRVRWLKYWSFSFSISPSSEHPGLISFRMDWLDLLAVQGTRKSLLQHHSSKASIL